MILMYFKEAMSSDVFINRASIGANDYQISPDKDSNRAGLTFSGGKEWQEHSRRFSLHQLRDLGFGNVTMEPEIIEEMQKCLTIPSRECEKMTTLNLRLSISILNALWHVLTSEKIEYIMTREARRLSTSSTLCYPLLALQGCFSCING